MHSLLPQLRGRVTAWQWQGNQRSPVRLAGVGRYGGQTCVAACAVCGELLPYLVLLRHLHECAQSKLSLSPRRIRRPQLVHHAGEVNKLRGGGQRGGGHGQCVRGGGHGQCVRGDSGGGRGTGSMHDGGGDTVHACGGTAGGGAVFACWGYNNNKRPLTPKSMPPTNDEQVKLKA